jgi:hypothetical protein
MSGGMQSMEIVASSSSSSTASSPSGICKRLCATVVARVALGFALGVFILLTLDAAGVLYIVTPPPSTTSTTPSPIDPNAPSATAYAAAQRVLGLPPPRTAARPHTNAAAAAAADKTAVPPLPDACPILQIGIGDSTCWPPCRVGFREVCCKSKCYRSSKVRFCFCLFAICSWLTAITFTRNIVWRTRDNEWWM